MLKVKSIKWVSLILAAVLILTAVTPVFASGMWARFVIGQKTYVVNGETKTMDTAPFIKDDRTFLPIRYAAYAVGVADSGIAWDAKARTVTITKGGDTIVLTVGSSVLKKNGSPTQMDVVPFIKDNRTFLPLRYVSEALGAKVDWDAATKTVTLTIGDATPPPIQPPVQPPTNGAIDMTAAMNGTLQPPAGAVAPPDVWGFPAKAVRMEFKVGSRYAKLWKWSPQYNDLTEKMSELDLKLRREYIEKHGGNPSGYDVEKYPEWQTLKEQLDALAEAFDLGTPCVIAAGEEDINFLKEKYPQGYNGANCIVLPNANYGAFYVPFIPVAEAFGVPAQNIVWDGQHLAVFGYYGNVANYRVLTPGTRDCVEKTVGNNPEVGTGKLDFPLFVKDGVPMVGIDSVSDVAGMLFSVAGGSVPGLIRARGGASWNYETGTAVAVITKSY